MRHALVTGATGFIGSAVCAALIEAGFDPDSIGISGVHVALRIAEQGPKRFVLLDFDKHWTRLFVVVDGQVAVLIDTNTD